MMSKTKAQKQAQRAREDAKKLTAAMAAFTLHYGKDETKLEKWQQLCYDCGLPSGPSIKKCKAVRYTYDVRYV